MHQADFTNGCPLVMCSCYDLPFSLLLPITHIDEDGLKLFSPNLYLFYIREDDRRVENGAAAKIK